MAYNREKKRDETKMKELRRVPLITQMKTSKIFKLKKNPIILHSIDTTFLSMSKQPTYVPLWWTEQEFWNIYLFIFLC